MKPNGKLIITDTVLPRPGSVPTATEVALLMRGLSMMQVRSGKERELDEWIAVLKGADERLRLRNAVQPFGSLKSVSEEVGDDAGRSDDRITSEPNGNMQDKRCHQSQLYRRHLPPDGISSDVLTDNSIDSPVPLLHAFFQARC